MSINTFAILNHAHAQINKKNSTNSSLEIIIPSSSSITEALSSNNNQKILFDATIDNTEWKNAKQFSFFSDSNNINLGKLYLQYNVIDNALEGAFVIPNSVGSENGGGSGNSNNNNNNDVLLHLLFYTSADDNGANMNSTLNPNNSHRIDISKNLQQARYFIGNGTNGWIVEGNSMQGNSNITMKMNEPFDKINIITSTDAQKWTGEFKIYFVQQSPSQQSNQQQQIITVPIKKIAVVQENYLSGKKITTSIPLSPSVSLTDSSTWAAISAPTKNTTTKLSTSFPLTPLDNQQKNQTPISKSSTEQQQQKPIPPKPNTTTTAVSNTTTASNNTNNATILKPTANTDSSGTIGKSASSPSNSEPSSTEPQNPLLNTSVLVALITTIGGVIGTITAAIIANKNKNKSS